jgi:hypothetical protein
MSNQQKKSKYFKLADITLQSAFDEAGNRTGEFKTDAEGKRLYRFKFNNNVKVVIDGVDFTGKTLYVDRPLNKYKNMLQKGIITKEEYEEQVIAHAAGGNKEFLQLEINGNFEDGDKKNSR